MARNFEASGHSRLMDLLSEPERRAFLAAVFAWDFKGYLRGGATWTAFASAANLLASDWQEHFSIMGHVGIAEKLKGHSADASAFAVLLLDAWGFRGAAQEAQYDREEGGLSYAR